LTSLRFIELDAGRHVVRLTLAGVGASGPQVHKQSVDVLPTRPAVLNFKTPEPIDVGVGGGVPVPRSPGAWPWVVTGTGVAALGVGIGLMAKASADRGVETDSEAAGRGIVSETTQAAHQAAWDDADGLSAAGAATIAVGGAALIGGLTWWLMTRESGAETRPQSGLWLAPSVDGGMVLGGRF